MKRRRLALSVVPFLALGCGDGMLEDPTGPTIPDPAMERIDATAEEGRGGDPHFYFLPPVVRQLFPYRGVFEPRAGRDLKAILTVDGAPQLPFVPFIRPRSNLHQEFYELHWPSPADATEARVEVWLADKPMGSLDLKAADTPQEIRSARTAGYAVFTPGRLTQIRMRVEVGAGEGVFPDRPRVADGRTTGDARLVFKPPVSRDHTEFGAFDPTVLRGLTVEVWAIEEEGPGRPGTQRVIKRFEVGNPVASDRVILNERKEFYQAIWSTRDAKPWLDYRARIFLRGIELGWIDIDVVTLDDRGPNWPYQLAFLKGARRSGAYAVMSGDEAFIRFRVEKSSRDEFDVTMLDLLPGHTSGAAWDVNESGQIVGRSCDHSECRAVLWYQGSITDLTPGQDGRAWGINDQGTVVGDISPPESDPVDYYPFLWENGELTALPGLIESSYTSGALDINEAGVVVGGSADESALPSPVLWRDGHIERLPHFGPDGILGVVRAVNDLGVAVGFAEGAPYGAAAAMWIDGVVFPLGMQGSRARDVNRDGVVVGNADIDGDGQRLATVWTDGVGEELPVPAEGDWETQAWGLNDRGLVVGSGSSLPGEQIPLAWPGGSVVVLPTLGGPIASATRVNNSGVIAGWSTVADDPDVERPVVWRPRQEPP